MNQEQKQWRRLSDFQSVRTSEQKEMVGKYLASRVIKTWKEDFIDGDTQEVVTIERNKILFERGTHITQDIAQQIMFSIQSEEIKDVEVCDEPNPRPYRIEYASQLPFEVRLADKRYIVCAQTIEQAIEIAAEYAAIYGDLGGCYYDVGGVKRIDANVIDDEDTALTETPVVANGLDAPSEEEQQDEEPRRLRVADIHYYQGTIRKYKLKKHKLKHDDLRYILPAQTMEQANIRLQAIAVDRLAEYVEEDPEHNTYKVLGAKPYDVEAIVPKSYSAMFLYKVD